jgi:type I restriction enzyme M protein
MLTSVFSALAVKPEFLTSDNRTTLKEGTFFGTERQNTAEIAKMNFILRGDGHSGIVLADTFNSYKGSDPANDYIGKRYSTVVTNIPFGVKVATSDGKYSKHISERYSALRCLAAVEPGGRAVLIVSAGLMTRTSAKDQAFRRDLWSRAHVELLVKLPEGTFAPYTTVESYMVYATDVQSEARSSKPDAPWYLEWNKTNDPDLSEILVNFREKK